MRVVGGSVRGRRLQSPRSQGVRPTTDRVRSAIFSILVAVEGATVADFYAGTGTLGIEALSRGARHVDFVEADPRQCPVVRANLAATGFADRARVLCLPAEKAVEGLETTYDLVLMDPPYTQPFPERVLRRLGNRPGLLHAGSRVVVGHASRVAPGTAYGCLTLAQDRRYGDTSVAFYDAGGPQ